ncbi:MAG TPA: CPBP family intramembrane glutamic endopeptidase [Sphingobacteriaceae bacterium]
MLKKIFTRLNFFFCRKKYHMQILYFYILTWIMTLLFFPLMYITRNVFGNEDGGPGVTNWFIIIVVAPILETFIFQRGVFKISTSLKPVKGKQALIILLSAFIFGLVHPYNLGYMLFAFSIGIVLAYVYYLFHRNPQKAFWTTALIHSLRNATAVLLVAFFP